MGDLDAAFQADGRSPTSTSAPTGYGMPGTVVDGMDPIACYAAVGEALTRARLGGGPTLGRG